ncbi:efflux transporter outer membrane subunit [Sphingomicrobium arenosum]|uniref:efflux transporter outer membrane subunit n=1 Tax=Sphingomicrobium arenosum TaxID=2233861 RepID=UPI002240FE36|nr:efflux transporter outer membrane subunit [Sphingomicrobium arenosum]
MTRRLALATASALMLSACAAGPGPVPSASDAIVPEAFYLAPEATPADAAALAALLPDDPAFETLAAAALAQNPSLRQALARIDLARAGADRAGAERLPSIGYDASIAATRTNPDQSGASLPPGISIDSERVSYGANLTARWDADVFGRLRDTERAALLRLDAAGADAAAMRLALTADIAATVTDWRTIEARSAALEADLGAASQLAALARTREEAGIAPGFDRYRAEAQAAASQSRLAALATERAAILGRLVTLTALPGGEVAQALALDTPSDALAPVPSALPSALVASRPDIIAAAHRLAAADADLSATAARRFPQINLSAGLGLLAFSLGGLFDSDAIVGNLGAGLAGPLLDFGRIEAEIDRDEAATQLAFEQYRAALYTAFGEVEGAYALVTAADLAAAASAREAMMAERAAALADTRHRAGLDNFLTVLEARRAADASGERAAAARGQAARARINLWQALGGGALASASEPTP